MTQPSLAQRLLDGDRRALARAITLVEDDRPEGWELVREVYPHTGAADVVGFTGPPGVGKSTLIGALTSQYGARAGMTACGAVPALTAFAVAAAAARRRRAETRAVSVQAGHLRAGVTR